MILLFFFVLYWANLYEQSVLGIQLCHLQLHQFVSFENQKLLTQKLTMEMELYRLKICGEQARLGVQFTGKYAVTCEGIQVSIPPNQVVPHTHKIDVKPEK